MATKVLVLSMLPDVECYNNARHRYIMLVGGLGLIFYSLGNAR
jgi:hypothetical protein